MEAQLKKVIAEVSKEASVLESTETEKTKKGIVISKGPACECTIEEGDTILFSGFAGVSYKVEDKEYIVLQQEEVLVKL